MDLKMWDYSIYPQDFHQQNFQAILTGSFFYRGLRRSEITMDNMITFLFLFFNFLNLLLGCSSVAYDWKYQCGNGSLYCRPHIYVWFLVGWSCCPPFCVLVCPLMQPSVCLPLSWGVVSEHSSTLCVQLQGPPRVIYHHRSILNIMWETLASVVLAVGHRLQLSLVRPSTTSRSLPYDHNAHIVYFPRSD